MDILKKKLTKFMERFLFKWPKTGKKWPFFEEKKLVWKKENLKANELRDFSKTRIFIIKKWKKKNWKKKIFEKNFEFFFEN